MKSSGSGQLRPDPDYLIQKNSKAEQIGQAEFIDRTDSNTFENTLSVTAHL